MGIPFINLTRRSIALLRGTALPDCQIARSLWQSLTRRQPRTPMCAWALRLPFSVRRQLHQLSQGPCWALGLRRAPVSHPPRPGRPGGPPPHSPAPPGDLESTASREWQLTMHHWRVGEKLSSMDSGPFAPHLVDPFAHKAAPAPLGCFSGAFSEACQQKTLLQAQIEGFRRLHTRYYSKTAVTSKVRELIVGIPVA